MELNFDSLTGREVITVERYAGRDFQTWNGTLSMALAIGLVYVAEHKTNRKITLESLEERTMSELLPLIQRYFGSDDDEAEDAEDDSGNARAGLPEADAPASPAPLNASFSPNSPSSSNDSRVSPLRTSGISPSPNGSLFERASRNG